MALYSRVWLSLQGLYAPTPHPQLQPRHTTDPGAIIKLVETDQGLLYFGYDVDYEGEMEL
jgi:hypothetical protein